MIWVCGKCLGSVLGVSCCIVYEVMCYVMCWLLLCVVVFGVVLVVLLVGIVYVLICGNGVVIVSGGICVFDSFNLIVNIDFVGVMIVLGGDWVGLMGVWMGVIGDMGYMLMLFVNMFIILGNLNQLLVMFGGKM